MIDKTDTYISPNKEISRAALKVAVGGGFSLLAGLASQVITAYLFGADMEMDSFFTALTVPLYLQIVLLGGLPFVVIPAFISEQSQGHEEDAWALTGSMIWLSAGVLLVTAIIGAIFSYQIIQISAPGYGQDKAILSSQMLRILMFTVPFTGLGTFTAGVENVRGRFFWPATATAVGSIGNVVVLLLLQPVIGPIALAWGNLASAILLAGITTIPILKHGWTKTLSWKDPRLVEMLRLLAPFIVFGLITNSKLILERYFASGLPDGQLAYIGYAYKIANIFVVLLASSIASAYFPTMARAFSTHGMAGLIKQSDYSLRVTLAVALPVVTIITVVAVPLIKIFYERGAFLPSATISVSLLIPIVMVNEVLFRMISNMVGRTFFILKDTFTTNLISSITILFYVAFAYFLTQKWGYWGLALAQPLQAGISILLIFALLVRRVRQFPILELGKSALKYLLFSLVAALIGWLVLNMTRQVSPSIQLIASASIASGVYLSVLYYFDQNIAISILDMTGLHKLISIIKTRFTPSNEAPPL